MRWKIYSLEEKSGERRTVRKFLFLPREFNGETRWLKFAYIIEEVQPTFLNHTYDIAEYEWVEIGFAT